MYECAIRTSAGRSTLAGMMVFAVALIDCVSVGPASAQTLGGPPAVVVDETVLDKLGPPPQSLPEVILQQQPQAYRPAPRDPSGSASESTAGAPERLLPPPSVMPRSRVMLPRNLKGPESQPSPRDRPQTARVPKKAPAPKPEPPETAPADSPAPVTRSMPAPEKPETPEATETPKTSVVPQEITPPEKSVPPAPTITPPAPAAEADTPAPGEPAPQAGVPEPSQPPVAETEMPKAPPPPAPTVAAPETPAVETPKPDTPKAADAPRPSTPESAAIPPAPKIVPPTPPAAAETPQIAENPASPRSVRPAPPAPPAASDSGSAKEATASDDKEASAPNQRTQIAALPEAPAAEVLDGGQIVRIPFGPTSAEISEDGKKYLDDLAQRMKDESSLRLQLLGYAGSTQDSASKARRTSLFRALSVRTYLMKQGVRSTRMDVRALGNRVEDGSPDRVDAVVRK